MAETKLNVKRGSYGIYVMYKENKGVSVSTSITNLISSTEIYGYKGSFGVENKGSEDVTVYPRVSFDGLTWFEMDNGSGITISSGGKQIIPFTGNYRYIKLDAVSTSTTNIFDAYMYVSSL